MSRYLKLNAGSAAVHDRLEATRPDGVSPGARGRWFLKQAPVEATMVVSARTVQTPTGRNEGIFAENREQTEVALGDLEFPFFKGRRGERRERAREQWRASTKTWADDLRRQDAAQPEITYWDALLPTSVTYGHGSRVFDAVGRDMTAGVGPFAITGELSPSSGGGTLELRDRRTDDLVGSVTIYNRDIVGANEIYSVNLMNEGYLRARLSSSVSSRKLAKFDAQMQAWSRGVALQQARQAGMSL